VWNVKDSGTTNNNSERKARGSARQAAGRHPIPNITDKYGYGKCTVNRLIKVGLCPLVKTTRLLVSIT